MDRPYQTRDLYLAAFLLINRTRLKETQAQRGIVYFAFENTPSLDRLTLDYFAGSSEVEPLQYIESIKRLRHLVKDRLQNNI